MGIPTTVAPGQRCLARLALHLPLLLMCALALAEGLDATRGLDWPWDRDQFRDIAQSQTVADGGVLADPFYLGESVFYNPLLAWIVALLARLLDLPVHATYTRVGAWIDLLAPICFYLLLVRWLGRLAATAATFHVLFLNVGPGASGEPFWANPTYSPWVLAPHLAQPFAFLCLLAYHRALLTGRRSLWVAGGVLLALAFLAHSGPFVLIALLVLIDALRAWRLRASRPSWLDLAAFFGSAALVAAPFIYSILGVYHLRIRNPAPVVWRWIPPIESALPLLVEQLSWASPLAVVGLVLLLARRPLRRGQRHLVTLFVVCSAFFLYAFVTELLARVGIHPIEVLPQHHFWFYLRVFESAFVGVALAALWQVVSQVARRRMPAWLRLRRPRWVAVAPVALLVGAGLAVVRSGYHMRQGFVVGREARLRAATNQRELDRTRVVAWMRAHAQPHEVFLASDLAGLLVVAPAGRRVVAVDRYFSNPYVDYEARADARDRLLDHLRGGRRRPFLRLARIWNVEWVLLWSAEPLGLDPHGPALVEPAFATEHYRVYRVRWESEARPG